MNRKQAISTIVKEVGNNPIISANGFISRDLYETCDRNQNFFLTLEKNQGLISLPSEIRTYDPQIMKM